MVRRSPNSRSPRASLPPAHHPIRAPPLTTRPSGFSRAAPQGAEGQGGERTTPICSVVCGNVVVPDIQAPYVGGLGFGSTPRHPSLAGWLAGWLACTAKGEEEARRASIARKQAAGQQSRHIVAGNARQGKASERARPAGKRWHWRRFADAGPVISPAGFAPHPGYSFHIPMQFLSLRFPGI